MTDEQEAMVEAGATPEQELASGVEADAMFAEDLEPERVPVPRWPDCWVELTAMDGMAMGRLYSVAQAMMGPADTPQVGRIDIAAFQRQLVLGTVTDFSLRRKSRVQDTGEVAWTEVRASACSDRKQRQQFIEDHLCGNPGKGMRGLAPGLWQWLVRQCERTNHMTPEARGN